MIFSMQYKLQNKVCVRTEADKVNLQVDVSASSKDKHKITSINGHDAGPSLGRHLSTIG